jgi:hypothetical protein
MAELHKECRITTADKVGKLAEVTDKVKAAGVNIVALCAWTEGNTGHLLMVAEDPDKACQAVQPVVDKCEQGEVVCVKVANKPGALEEVSRKLADAGVGIELCYATTVGGDQAAIVLHTTDNAKAAGIV